MNTTIKGDEKLGQSIDAVLKTEAGRTLWAYLFHACGYNVSSLSRNPSTGEMDRMSTECKEAQRFIYVNLRKLASRELLRVAEDLAETPIPQPVPLTVETKSGGRTDARRATAD